VAAHLARAEPQTLVLDDPCVHVSRERTAHLVDILNTLTAAGRVQVVVLTHRQSEFSGLLGTAIDVSAV
jgi:energy-coupling factor transporter ATP-binding protein EcfA2